MNDEEPSQSALMAAAGRAAHLIVDREPFIFEDTVAHALLGDQAEELMGYHKAYGDHPILSGVRAQVTARSHYTEHRLAELAVQGLTQYVILGAGLDTFAYRSPLVGQVTVYEVDHPTTQHWKRALLASAGITPPDNLSFVGIDFETDTLPDRLTAHGFDPNKPALVSWLGVSMYLTTPAITTTLTAIGHLAPTTELIMEYALPPAQRDEKGAAYADIAMTATAERGEPWLTFFTPEELSATLADHALDVAEHIRQQQAIPSTLWQRHDPLVPVDVCRLVRAAVRAKP
ncbi:SAM-dependent methyltransferase [Acrocarpospora macrocephala]|uniref:S-adenosyl-L-methionine-dependent methyltransferase n=1 Tax=Acrocarpospora macrocephala TaxID=150177 RepID=A0A5M3WL63_9ACTN|nr:class I SAM-dependent methyltransferase [Acrocarpospora macrocephala]GES07971.1 S-adenosyl-L-methionine-dependent methyltransferase [Acrocarpospora macrocephala]